MSSVTLDRQAQILRELRDAHKDVWKQLHRDIKGQLDHWLAGRRPLTKEGARQIAEGLFDTPEDVNICFERLIAATERDKNQQRDLRASADNFFRNLKMAKLIYPPFSTDSMNEESGAFLDGLLNRFFRSTGHPVKAAKRPDLATMLDGMLHGKRQTVRVGIGLLSTLDVSDHPKT